MRSRRASAWVSGPILMALVICASAVGANAPRTRPAFQYKSGDIEIPAATADEPKVKFDAASIRLAAKYLDDGAVAWVREKSCINCHSTGTYMTDRPALSKYLGKPKEEVLANFIRQIPDKAPAATQRSGEPFYPDAHRAVWRSAGLAEWDRHITGKLSEHTEKSLKDMLLRQSPNGRFTMSGDTEIPHVTSDFELTLQAARAVTAAPGWLENLRDADLLRRVDLMKKFLREDKPRNDYERVLRLQLASYMPDLVPQPERDAAIRILSDKQLPDGGWSTRRMSDPQNWRTGTSQRVIALIQSEPDAANPGSDSYMTAFAVVLLRQTGIPATDPRIARGIEWLKSNQRASGRWWMKSLYKDTHHYSTSIATMQALKALGMCGELRE